MVELTKYPDVYAAAHPVRLMLRDVIANCVGPDAKEALTIERTTWALCYGLIWLISESEIVLEEGSDESERLIDGALQVRVVVGRGDSAQPRASRHPLEDQR